MLHPYTIIDLRNEATYRQLAVESAVFGDKVNVQHFTERANFYGERALRRERNRNNGDQR